MNNQAQASTIMSQERRTYTVEEIQSILGIGRSTAYKLVNQNCFRTVRVGNRVVISSKSFDEWLDNNIS